ncbi:putative peptide modification system cyclase, partial [Xanthomonas maliensis]
MTVGTQARKEAAAEAIQAPRLRTLLLTDLCDSTAMVERIGDSAAAELFREHDHLVVRLQQRWHGRLIDRSDGLLLLFERPIDGLGFALDYAQGLLTLGKRRNLQLHARQGLHVGEVLTWRNSDEAVQIGAKPLEVEGLAKPTAARLMSMARPGQILLSAVAESLVQRAARELGERAERLLWKSHGRWRFKGVPTGMEIYEVGEVGFAPLRMPRTSAKAWREIPLWRRPSALITETVVFAAAAFLLWFFTRPEPAIAFSERDWVVMGDLRNLTGNATLDGAVDQAFRISLEQSRYVNVLSDDKTRGLLGLMRKDPSKDLLDRGNASAVALRAGAHAVLLPSIADVGGRKRFSVEIIDPRTQQTLAVSSAYANNRSVLDAVDTVTGDLRQQLGETIGSVRDNAMPLPEVTTASMDALRAFALGQKRYFKGDPQGALGFYSSATDIDSNFALAWLGQARANFLLADYPQANRALRTAQNLTSRLPAREAMYAKILSIRLVDPFAAADAWAQMAEL